MTIKLYYHKTDGGAEYLMDKYIEWEHNGKSGREGVLKGSKYIVRIDGDIEKDAELMISEEEKKCAGCDEPILENQASVYGRHTTCN